MKNLGVSISSFMKIAFAFSFKSALRTASEPEPTNGILSSSSTLETNISLLSSTY